MRGRLITIALAGALLAAAAVVPALGSSSKAFSTTVTIKTDAAAGKIFGKVKSDKRACFKKRKVILNVDGNDVFDTKADEDGFYGIKTQSGNPLNPGDYEVHSPKKVVSNKVTCKPGNSKIVTVN